MGGHWAKDANVDDYLTAADMMKNDAHGRELLLRASSRFPELRMIMARRYLYGFHCAFNVQLAEEMNRSVRDEEGVHYPGVPIWV